MLYLRRVIMSMGIIVIESRMRDGSLPTHSELLYAGTKIPVNEVFVFYIITERLFLRIYTNVVE
jgi:hypothetical protein